MCCQAMGVQGENFGPQQRDAHIILPIADTHDNSQIRRQNKKNIIIIIIIIIIVSSSNSSSSSSRCNSRRSSSSLVAAAVVLQHQEKRWLVSNNYFSLSRDEVTGSCRHNHVIPPDRSL